MIITGPVVSRIPTIVASGTMFPASLRILICLMSSIWLRKSGIACTLTCQVRPNRLKSLTYSEPR